MITYNQNWAGYGGFIPIIPALWEAKTGRSPEVRSSRPAWPTWWNPISTKNTKSGWAWWWAPVISATWEAEAGESLEPRRRRLWWAKIVPLHSSLGDRVRLCLRKTKQLKNKKNLWSWGLSELVRMLGVLQQQRYRALDSVLQVERQFPSNDGVPGRTPLCVGVLPARRRKTGSPALVEDRHKLKPHSPHLCPPMWRVTQAM